MDKIQSFNPPEIAHEVIEVLAKHRLTINALDIVFCAVCEELKRQTIVSFKGD